MEIQTSPRKKPRGRWNAFKTECPKGHPYKDDNLAVYVDSITGKSTRVCKQCKRDQAKSYYDRIGRLRHMGRVGRPIGYRKRLDTNLAPG